MLVLDGSSVELLPLLAICPDVVGCRDELDSVEVASAEFDSKLLLVGSSDDVASDEAVRDEVV